MGIDEYLMLEAKEEEQEKFVKNLLAKTEFSKDKIADLVGVSIDFVEEVKESLVSK